MRLHPSTWFALAAGLVLLLLANFWCWRPGIGYRLAGVEVELFYGWPATYRADWWRSADSALGPVLLAGALGAGSDGGLELHARYASAGPLLADVAFGVAALVAAGAALESLARGRWTLVRVVAVAAAGAVLAWTWAVADGISVHL